MQNALAVLMSIAAGLGLVHGKADVAGNHVQGTQAEAAVTPQEHGMGYMKFGFNGNENALENMDGKIKGISNAIQRLERNIDRKYGPTGSTGTEGFTGSSGVDDEKLQTGPVGPTGQTGNTRDVDRTDAVNIRSGYYMPHTIPTMAIGNSKALELPDLTGTPYPLPPGRERNGR